MATVTVNITTKPFQAPAGTIVGAFKYTLTDTDSGATLVQATAGTSAVFDSVPPGNYSPKVERVDNSGATLGVPIVGFPFSVAAPAAPPVLTTVPESINVVVG